MKLSRRTFSSLFAGSVLAPSGLGAQTRRPTALVELFTSQGCSSCPPADALMARLAQDPSTLPLTYSVDIWDYLGWRDTMAKPAFTRRQRAYAGMVANKRVYTPQAIVNGRADCVGSDYATITRLQRNYGASLGAYQVAASANAGNWSVAISGRSNGGVPRAFLLPVSDTETVAIGRGENRGQTITYVNVVRDLIELGPVDSSEKSFAFKSADIAKAGGNSFAVLVQNGTMEAPGEVLGLTFVGSDRLKS